MKKTLLNSFYEDSIILIPEVSDKDTAGKENYRLIPLISTDAQNITKICPKLIQQCIKRVVLLKQVRFTPRMQKCFNIIKSVL